MAIAIGDDLRHNDVTSLAALTRTSPPAHDDPSDAINAEASRVDLTTKWVWIGYAVLSVLIFAYLISLLVRSPAQQWTWLDGWSTVAVEVIASSMCIARGLYKRPGRSAPLALGFALLAWTVGDALLTYRVPRRQDAADALVGRSLLRLLLPPRLRRRRSTTAQGDGPALSSQLA